MNAKRSFTFQDFKIPLLPLLGKGFSNRSSENPGIAKIGLTPLPQSWHSGGFDDKSA